MPITLETKIAFHFYGDENMQASTRGLINLPSELQSLSKDDKLKLYHTQQIKFVVLCVREKFEAYLFRPDKLKRPTVGRVALKLIEIEKLESANFVGGGTIGVGFDIIDCKDKESFRFTPPIFDSTTCVEYFKKTGPSNKAERGNLRAIMETQLNNEFAMQFTQLEDEIAKLYYYAEKRLFRIN